MNDVSVFIIIFKKNIYSFMSADETVRLVLVEKYAEMMISMLVIAIVSFLEVVTPTEDPMTSPPPSTAGGARGGVGGRGGTLRII